MKHPVETKGMVQWPKGLSFKLSQIVKEIYDGPGGCGGLMAQEA